MSNPKIQVLNPPSCVCGRYWDETAKHSKTKCYGDNWITELKQMTIEEYLQS